MTLDMQLTKSVVAEHVGREGQLYQQSECLTAQQIATLLGMPVTGRVHKPQGPRSHRNSPSLAVDGERLSQSSFQSTHFKMNARVILYPVQEERRGLQERGNQSVSYHDRKRRLWGTMLVAHQNNNQRETSIRSLGYKCFDSCLLQHRHRG